MRGRSPGLWPITWQFLELQLSASVFSKVRLVHAESLGSSNSVESGGGPHEKFSWKLNTSCSERPKRGVGSSSAVKSDQVPGQLLASGRAISSSGPSARMLLPRKQQQDGPRVVQVVNF